MAKVPETAPLSNVCVFCGISLHTIARRNPMPLPGNPQAAACATCLRRKGPQSISSYVATCIAEAKATCIRLEAILGPGPKVSRAEKAKLDAAPLTGIALLRKTSPAKWTDDDIEAMAEDSAAKAQNTNPAEKHYSYSRTHTVGPLAGQLDREYLRAELVHHYVWERDEALRARP